MLECVIAMEWKYQRGGQVCKGRGHRPSAMCEQIVVDIEQAIRSPLLVLHVQSDISSKLILTVGEREILTKYR